MEVGFAFRVRPRGNLVAVKWALFSFLFGQSSGLFPPFGGGQVISSELLRRKFNIRNLAYCLRVIKFIPASGLNDDQINIATVCRALISKLAAFSWSCGDVLPVMVFADTVGAPTESIARQARVAPARLTLLRVILFVIPSTQSAAPETEKVPLLSNMHLRIT